MSELLEEFEKEFAKIKKELGFKATLNELDDIFFLNDFISKEGFVSEKLSRQICRRIVELFMSWAQYLHGFLVVNPSSLISIVETQLFDEDGKEEITKMLDKMMALSARNNLIGLTKDKSKEKIFIDDSVVLWKEVSPKLEKIMKKVGDKWEERAIAKPVKEDKELRRIYG